MADGGSLAKVTIERLNENNYEAWSFRMMMLLVDRGLWDLVQEEESPSEGDASNEEDSTGRARNSLSPEEIEKRKSRQQKALALIGLHVSDVFLPHIQDARTPKGLWKKLEKLYAKHSQAYRIQLRRELQRMQLKKVEKITEYVKRIKNISHRLSSAGYVPSEDEQVCAMLNGLPKEYETICTILESQTEDLTMQGAIGTLLLTESKLNKEEVIEEGESAFHAKEQRRCYYCKRKGHIIKNCRKRLKDIKSKKGQASERHGYEGNSDKCQVAFITSHSEGNGKDHWLIDSGASSHMTCRKEWLKNFQKPSKLDFITLGDGRKIQIEGSGTVSMSVTVNGKFSKVTLKDVLYVPQLLANLISLTKTTKGGLNVIFSNDMCTINDQKSGNIIAQAVRCNNLYNLIGMPIREQESTYIAHEQNINVWHYRLGHLNKEALHKLSSEMANGITIKKEGGSMSFCEPCAPGKAHRTPAPKGRESTTERPLELLHSDLCGPINPQSLGGSSYIITLMDDCTRYSWIGTIKRKSDAVLHLKNLINLIEKHYCYEVKRLRTDRGGEYLSGALQSYLKRKGILHETTTPYTPSQNGVAERLNRTLIEKARCLMSHLNEKGFLWAEAVMTANYLGNRSPTKAVRNSTPYEILTKKKPSVRHLKIFGSPAYILIQKQLRKRKIGRVSEKGIMVGYSTKSKGYRIYMENSRKIIISKDVTFNEMEIVQKLKCSMRNTELDLDDPPLTSREEKDHFLQSEEEDIAESIEKQVGASSKRIYPERERRQAKFYQPGESTSETVAMVYTEPRDFNEIKNAPDKELWNEAIQEELTSLRQNNTWELCSLPEVRKPITSKWIFKLKRDEKGKVVRHKARLVARGFTRKYEVDYSEVFAPVSRRSTFRALMAVANMKDMEIVHLDIKTAFLNGKLNEDVYMEPPQGCQFTPRNALCRLRKAIYGLKQSPRVWNERLKSELEKMGFRQGKSDSSLYSKSSSSGKLYLLAYVDDLIVVCKNAMEINQSIDQIGAIFSVRNLGDIRSFLGIQVVRHRARKTLKITQEQFINSLLSTYKMENCYPNKLSVQVGKSFSKCMGSDSMKDQELMENIPYQNLVGSLLYLSNCTRPDISYVVGALSRSMSNPGGEHWKAAKGVLRYLKGTSSVGIGYGNRNGIEAYCDANYAGDLDTRRSTTGFVVTFTGGSISWMSKVQKTVALSTTEAEYMAAADVCKELIWCRRLLSDLSVKTYLEEIKINCDNQSCMELAKNPTYHKRAKHIDVRYHFVRDLVNDGKVRFEYCRTEGMVADSLTKPVPIEKQRFCSKHMGLSS